MRAIDQSSSVQFAADVSEAPGPPAVGAGADITDLKQNSLSARHQRVRLDLASGACTLTGPVVIYGEDRGKVYKIGVLNDGDDIVLASPGGYAAILQFVGIYDRFGLSPAGIVGGGSYDGFIEGVELL